MIYSRKYVHFSPLGSICNMRDELQSHKRRARKTPIREHLSSDGASSFTSTVRKTPSIHHQQLVSEDQENLFKMTMQRLQFCCEKTASTRRRLTKFKILKDKHLRRTRGTIRTDRKYLSSNGLLPRTDIFSPKIPSDIFMLKHNPSMHTANEERCGSLDLRNRSPDICSTPQSSFTSRAGISDDLSLDSNYSEDCPTDSEDSTDSEGSTGPSRTIWANAHFAHCPNVSSDYLDGSLFSDSKKPGEVQYYTSFTKQDNRKTHTVSVHPPELQCDILKDFSSADGDESCNSNMKLFQAQFFPEVY
jgi:hypothetical protein